MGRIKYFGFISICFLFVFLFSFNVSAEIVIPYKSVDTNNIYINDLIDTMQNQSDYDSFLDWFACSVSDNEYCLFYNINDNNATRLFLQVNLIDDVEQLSFHKSIIDDLSFLPNDYSIVGNISGSLGSSKYIDYHFDFIITLTIVVCCCSILFFVFRIRKKQKTTMAV